MAGGEHAWVAIACVSSFGGGDFFQTGYRRRARVDFHVGNTGHRRRLSALPARARTWRRAHLLLGESYRLRAAGLTLPPARSAAPEQHRAHRSGGRGSAAGVEGQRRTRLPAVYGPAGARARARIARRGDGTRRHELSAAGSGRRIAIGIADAFPKA